MLITLLQGIHNNDCVDIGCESWKYSIETLPENIRMEKISYFFSCIDHFLGIYLKSSRHP